jgi:DNA-binding response OmpR family regulator
MSKRILIVEDDHDILSLLKDVLEKEGFEVNGLNYTDSIVKSAQKHNADLIIVDFLLPGINGGELCHEIKCHPSTASLPVIMLSAFPRVLESLGNYGADAFMAKPFDIKNLVNTVQRCFNANPAVSANA